MKICPNLSNPEVREKFEAIESDPELGRIEAVREFLEAEKQGREMGTPQQVKNKLHERFLGKSNKAQQEKIEEYTEELLKKSNDPVYSDPNMLMGNAILHYSDNNFNLNNNELDNTKAKEIIGKMSSQLGIGYEIVTAEEAAIITQNAANPYDANKGPAFFYGETVYFIKDNLSTSVALHEFSHPLIRAIQNSNPILFTKLYDRAVKLDPSLLEEAYNEYSDLKRAVEEEVNQEAKTDLMRKYQNLVREEVLVKALTRKSNELYTAQEQKTGFRKLVDDILYGIKKILRSVFGQKVDVAKLDVNTTLDQLSEMLLKGDNFEIDTSLVTEADVAAYFQEQADYVRDFNKVVDKVGNKNLLTMIKNSYEGAIKHIQLLEHNKNYKELADILGKIEDSELFQIKQDLRKYASIIEAHSRDVQDDIKETDNQVRNLVQTMMRLEFVMNKVERHLNEMKEDPEDQNYVHKTQYYSHFIDYWDSYITQVKSIMSDSGADSRSSIMQLINSIKDKVDRSTRHINTINNHGVADVLWDQWKSLSERAEAKFDEQVKTLKAKGASQSIIDKKYISFYGMTEQQLKEYKELESRYEEGKVLTYDEQNKLEALEKKADKGLHMSKKKISEALKGHGRDANFFNSYFEGYLYNTDPIIGGFAMFYKKNMAEMEARAASKQHDFATELQPLLKDAGVNFRNPGELGKQIGFIDVVGHFNTETGEYESKKIWTLLNPFKDYRYDIDKLNYEIKELKNRYYRTNSDEDHKALILKYEEKNSLLRKFFHQQYIDEYYDDTTLVKGPNDEIGLAAQEARDKLIEKINQKVNPLMGEYEILAIEDEIEQNWREYRMLYSLRYGDGTMKKGRDLEIAKRLQEHREKTRKYYEWKLKEGSFENALKNFEDETYQRLSRNMNPTSPEFEELFKGLREQWIQKNTRVVIKQSFYEKRAEILEKIQNITKNLPSSMDFTQYWNDILDVVSGYRDSDGQPIGTDVTDGRRAVVKEAQEIMEELKAQWAGMSGLSTAEMNRLQELIKLKKAQKIKKGDREWAEMVELIQLQKAKGLNDFQKKELQGYFNQLKALQSKTPTEYYLDTLNFWLESLNIKSLRDAMGVTSIDESNIEAFYKSSEVLSDLFDQSPAFKEWFDKNHIQTTKFDAEQQEKLSTYERLYIWNVVRPNDSKYYETTTIVNRQGKKETIPGLPKLKYYKRSVKDEFKTGYDPNTGEVKRVIGLHKDNRGDWLPKMVKGSKYINEEYFKLKNASPDSQEGKLFKILEVITKHHLKNQESLSRKSKLYLDFPRFEKSGLEVLRSRGVGGTVKDKMLPLRLIFQRIMDFIKGRAKSGSGDEYNWDEKNDLVRADAFGDQIDNIPIQGLYNLSEDETSTDIITSVLRYMWGAEHQTQLYKMNPVAKALKGILEDPKNKITDPDKLNLNNFVNYGIKTFVNKKGAYIRKNAFNNFYDKYFMKQTTTGPLGKSNIFVNLQQFLFGRASFSFFAFNIPSAMKNWISPKFQAIIESSAGENITPATYVKGEGWAFQYMYKLSMGDAYAKGQKSLHHQIGEIFDPVQGRLKEKFGESITRTVMKDSVGTSWFYNFRKWTELQSSMQIFAAMMYKQKIPMGEKMINYMDAWELGADGKIKLKDGVDPKWGITYDEEGNMVIGEEFNLFRNRVHAVMNKLQGAYADFDQPEAQRYLAFRFVSYLRRFFTTMFIHRFGNKRWNPGYGEIDEGYYREGTKGMFNFFKSGFNFHAMTSSEKSSIMRMMTEMFVVQLLSFIILNLFGYDEEDEERYQKLRQKSGPLRGLFIADDKDRPFNLGGFLDLHMLHLAMGVRSETEQFLPTPGYIMDNASTIIDLKSIVFGPTTDTYRSIWNDMQNIMSNDPRMYYKRRVGPYQWQQKGGMKLWAHVAKMFGVTGSSMDPAQAAINLSKARNLARAK